MYRFCALWDTPEMNIFKKEELAVCEFLSLLLAGVSQSVHLVYITPVPD